jgi:hypothetical protein
MLDFTTSLTTTTAQNDMEQAFNAIRAKRPSLDLLMSYYTGPQPLKYSTMQLAELFHNITAHFEINWCSLIIDAALDRIQLTGFDTDDKTVNAKLDKLFDRIHLDIEADKAHQYALTSSQGYIIAWKDEDGVIECYANDPRLCAVFYDPEHPNKKTYAAKWFNRTDGSQEITLYYPDRIEHWGSPKTTSPIDKASGFTLETVEANTYGVIPVFELKSPGEIFKVLSLQDAVNKLFSDLMVTSDAASIPQKFVISGADPGALKNGKNIIWWLPAGDNQGQNTSAGQFEAAPLSNFFDAIDPITNSMAIITRTPKHYFTQTGSNISGEALIAMENPLVRKCEKRQREFAAQWQSIATFLAQLEGITIEPSAVNVIWEKVASTQPKTDAEVNQILVNTGINLRTVLRDSGWSEEDLNEMDKDQEIMDKSKKTLAQAVLTDLRNKQNQMNAVDTQPNQTQDNTQDNTQ